MKIDYVKHRDFLRDFKRFRDEADPNVVYEIVGGKGESIGYFTLNDPRNG